MRQNVCGMFIAKRGGTTTGELARDARCLRNGDPGIKLGVVDGQTSSMEVIFQLPRPVETTRR